MRDISLWAKGLVLLPMGSLGLISESIGGYYHRSQFNPSGGRQCHATCECAVAGNHNDMIVFGPCNRISDAMWLNFRE